MGFPVTQYPQARVVTSLIRSMLPDEPIGPGVVFTPTSAAADASGNVTLVFNTPPGFILNDSLVLQSFSPSAWNGNFKVTAAAGVQITIVNPAVASTSPTVIGIVQGYGTGRNYTDTKLMPLLNSAYRSIQRALKAAGSTELKVANFFATIPGINFPDATTNVVLGFNGLSIISDANPPPTWLDIPTPTWALPQDCLRPLYLWEKQTGNQAEGFSEMTDLTEGAGLPSIVQSFRLGMWEWIEDGINFIGALQDEDIRIRYQRGLPALADGASQVMVLDSQEYLTAQTCYLVEVGRGGKNAQIFQAQAEDHKDKLVSMETRAQQSVSRRPRPFSSRHSRRGWVF